MLHFTVVYGGSSLPTSICTKNIMASVACHLKKHDFLKIVLRIASEQFVRCTESARALTAVIARRKKWRGAFYTPHSKLRVQLC